ncbi:hypothetical protein [Candidatus Tisiphia endosymbiont of Melanophora roralis]|uniref:hypothetical protein n=1 Tax=Candidatus Tisiphia endosymbiont of Melanophora roralis TaxID=3066261 RepID=UPI00312C9908
MLEVVNINEFKADLENFRIEEPTDTSNLFSSFSSKKDLLDAIKTGNVEKCETLFKSHYDISSLYVLSTHHVRDCDVYVFSYILSELIKTAGFNSVGFLQTLGKAIDDPNINTGAWLYLSVSSYDSLPECNPLLNVLEVLEKKFKNIRSETKYLVERNSVAGYSIFSKNATKDTESKSITSDENSDIAANTMLKIADLENFRIEEPTDTSNLFSSFSSKKDLLDAIKTGNVEKCETLFKSHYDISSLYVLSTHHVRDCDVYVFSYIFSELIKTAGFNSVGFLQTLGKAIDDPNINTGAWLYLSASSYDSLPECNPLLEVLEKKFKNIRSETKYLVERNSVAGYSIFSKNVTKDTESKSITSDENSDTVYNNCDPQQAESLPIAGEIDTVSEDFL